VRKVGRAMDLACGISDGLGSGSVLASFCAVAVLRTGFASAGHWPVAAAIARTNLRWRKTKHPTSGAFTKPKNLF